MPRSSEQVVGVLQARPGSVDRAVERLRRRAVHLEEPLEREAHVARRDRRAVGVAHAAAQRQRPRAAAVVRARQPRREVGHDAVGGCARGLAERGQAVLRHLVQVPVLRGRVDLRIGGAAVRRRERDERAAAVARAPASPPAARAAPRGRRARSGRPMIDSQHLLGGERMLQPILAPRRARRLCRHAFGRAG